MIFSSAALSSSSSSSTIVACSTCSCCSCLQHIWVGLRQRQASANSYLQKPRINSWDQTVPFSVGQSVFCCSMNSLVFIIIMLSRYCNTNKFGPNILFLYYCTFCLICFQYSKCSLTTFVFFHYFPFVFPLSPTNVFSGAFGCSERSSLCYAVPLEVFTPLFAFSTTSGSGSLLHTYSINATEKLMTQHNAAQ